MTPATARTEEHRRRVTDTKDPAVASAVTVAALRLALVRLSDQLDEAERLLHDEKEDMRRGNRR